MLPKLDTYLGWKVDFANPPGTAAFCEPSSVSWRVLKNPIALSIGGVAAVLMEFADARIRTGVWEHSTFKQDPIGRSHRTGMAAMIGVYAPQAAARRVIQGVTNMHARVQGRTPDRESYRALDVELLNWVSATAAWSFLTAYDRFVAPLSEEYRHRYYAEGAPVARLYGVETPLASDAEFERMMQHLLPRFEPHPIVTEFLNILQSAPSALGLPRALGRKLAQASVSILPGEVRERLQIGAAYNLSKPAAFALRRLGAMTECIPILQAPPAQACVRLGLPADFLYRSPSSQERALARWTSPTIVPAP